jgi:hypothetical protein
VFYTIFESAKAVGADPEAYLRYATELMRRGETPLLPHEWVSQKATSLPDPADTPPQ